MVLFKCKCGAALVTDEGKTVRVSMTNWRMNKQSGLATADCPKCPTTFVLNEGIRRRGEEMAPLNAINMLFAVGVT